MKKKNYACVEIIAKGNGKARKAAFAKGINRDVNLANAEKIFADIKINGYRQAEMVQVVKGEDAIANGDITLVDIDGNEIPTEEAHNYYLILDGQHRVYATSIYNAQMEESPIQVPAIIVELNKGETIAEYISAINVTKSEWKANDYVRGAANVLQTEILLRYKELIKSEDNHRGFPLSTINLIFFGNSKALSKSDFSLLCQGKTEKGTKTKKKIIEGESINRGNKFIELCFALGFNHRDIAKRYLIERFEKLRNSKDEEYAFKVFNTITPNDRQAMFNENGNLTESLVIEQFNIIISRLEN